MFMIFFDGGRKHKIAIPPEGQNKNITYFIECVVRPLTAICYPQNRGIHERRVMLYFDNPPIRNAEAVQESLTNFGLRRMRHSSYGPDLAPCDFFSVQ
jgi:hypothetical protein